MDGTLHRFIFDIFDIFSFLFPLDSLQLNHSGFSGSLQKPYSLTFFNRLVVFEKSNHKCKIHILSIRWSTVDNVLGGRRLDVQWSLYLVSPFRTSVRAATLTKHNVFKTLLKLDLHLQKSTWYFLHNAIGSIKEKKYRIYFVNSYMSDLKKDLTPFMAKWPASHCAN